MRKPGPVLLLFSLLVLHACKRDTIEPDAVACFGTDKRLHKPGEMVTLQNCSENFDNSEWDFGDGHQSNEMNPVHTWSIKGPYVVTLKVIKGNKSDVISKRISIADSVYPAFVVEFSKWHQAYKDSTFNFYMYSLQGQEFSQATLFYNSVQSGSGAGNLLEGKLKLQDAAAEFKIKFLMVAKDGDRDSLTTEVLFITDVAGDIPWSHSLIRFAEVNHHLTMIYK